MAISVPGRRAQAGRGRASPGNCTASKGNIGAGTYPQQRKRTGCVAEKVIHIPLVLVPVMRAGWVVSISLADVFLLPVSLKTSKALHRFAFVRELLHTTRVPIIQRPLPYPRPPATHHPLPAHPPTSLGQRSLPSSSPPTHF